MEQIYILKNHTDIPQQGIAGEILYIPAANLYRTAVYIIKTCDQITKRGLSAPGRPDNSGCGILRNPERNIL